MLKLLDICCGAGGAADGYYRAGFREIVGVDINFQKNYPYDFIQGDIHNLPVDIFDFNAVHISPPCQLFSVGTMCLGLNKYELASRYPNLIPISQKILEGHPFTIIENVPRAPIRGTLVLNGPTVGLPFILRKRKFECSFWIRQPVLEKINVPITFTIAAGLSSNSPTYRRKVEEAGLPMSIPNVVAKVMMGIDFFHKMTNQEICESVPPPMTEFIGRELIRQLRRKR